jgi:MFS family permease
MLAFIGSSQAMAPFIPLHAQQLGMSAGAIGLLLGGQGVAGLAASLAGGAWMGAIGPRRMAFWSSLVSFAALVALWRWPTIAMLAVTLSIVWAAGALVGVASQTLVLTSDAGPRRDHIVGMHAFYASLGTTIGPLLGTATVRAGGELSAVFLTAAVMCGLAAPVSLLAAKRSSVDVARPSGLWGVGRLTASAVLALGAVFTAEFVYVAWMTFYPLALDGWGHRPEFVGVIFTVHGIALSLVRPWLAAIVARSSRAGIIVLSFVVFGAGLALAAVSKAAPTALAAAVLTGVAVGFIFPLTMVLVTHEAVGERVARLLGLRFAIMTGGAMLGPVVIGGVAAAGLPAAMAATAALCGVATLWAFWIDRGTVFLTLQNRR